MRVVAPAPSSASTVVAVEELWAIPLDGSTPRVALRFRSAYVPGRDTRGVNALRQQFSPDGKRVVLSVVDGDDPQAQLLEVVDLETGRIARLFEGERRNDVKPAWSPDGRLIAFVRLAAVGSSGDIWVSAPDGTAARRIRAGTQGSSPRVYGWLPDSQRIGFDPVNFEWSGYRLIDLDGVESGDTGGRSATTADPVSWQTQSPWFAGGFGDAPRPSRTQILLADWPAQQTPWIFADVVPNPADNTITGVRDPRWDPKDPRVLVYLESGIQGSAVIADLAARTSIRIGGRVSLADWTPNGTAVVTLEEHPPTAPLSAYVWGRDGKIRSGGLFLPLDGAQTIYSLTDLAVRAY
ncbi:MAG TPA: hypothetical protein VGT60_01960 [Candidatus Limnocylindria bacterium]|nr:hypothetical protein [Candidatus Limnocylindria bacterium]